MEFSPVRIWAIASGEPSLVYSPITLLTSLCCVFA